MQSKISFKIAQNENDLYGVYKFQHSIFVADKGLLESNIPLLKDEWDDFSYHIFCKKEHEIVGDGRLIKDSPIGFRVSSSIDINNFFRKNDTIFEISALGVAKSARHLGIGHSIHYLRLTLAAELSGSFAIASCFRSNAHNLTALGFEILIDKFDYKQYKASEPSTFLAFDLSKNSSSFKKLEKCINSRLPAEQLQELKNYSMKLSNTLR